MKSLKLILAMTAASLCAQDYYEVRSLGVLPGYLGSVATAINENGWIAGFSFNRTFGDDRAFLYKDCKLYDLGSLGGGTSTARGINDWGLIVGNSRNKDGVDRAFSWFNGVMQDMGGPPATTEFALGVGNTGHAVGFEFIQNQNPSESATMYNNPVQPVLYLPSFQGARVNRVTAINEYNHAVGFSRRNNGEVWGVFYMLADYPGHFGAYRISPVTADGRVRGLELSTQPNAVSKKGISAGVAGFTPRHAFVSPNFFQPAIDLGTLNPSDPSLSSEAMGINDSEHVVGWSESAPGVFRAFLHDGSKMIDLNTRLINPTGWELLEANAINDKGEIVGKGRYNGQLVAYVLFPRSSPKIPESPCIVGKLP